LFIVSNFKTASAENVLEVPSTQYPTIQSAVNAVKDGETIKVASGTYNENIVWRNSTCSSKSKSANQKRKQAVTLQVIMAKLKKQQQPISILKETKKCLMLKRLLKTQ